MTPAGSTLRGSAGDWLLSDGSAEWTVGAMAFAKTYAKVSATHWRKTGTVRAQRLTSEVDIETQEGTAHAEAGDWLVESSESGAWPVTNAVFRERYITD